MTAGWDDEPTEPGHKRPSQRAPGPLRPMTHAERVKTFGRFRFVADPRPDNPEHIRVTDGWAELNIVPIVIPFKGGRIIHVHRLVAKQLQGLWEDWQKAGVLDQVLTFDGAYASRYKRGRAGGEENLSNHAWGTAFDLNAKWNRLGHLPASSGATGSMHRLAPFMEARGFFYGGNFKGSRVDGMHAECARVIA